jgi:NitT/TauT family transport system substrate-binding protein
MVERLSVALVPKSLMLVVAVGVALLVVSGSSATTARHQKSQDTSITAILGSVVPDIAQGQNYIPVTEGWDAADGVHVSNQAVNGALAAISALQAGQGDVSPSLADNIPLAVAKGGGVISVAQIAYSPSFSVVFPAKGDYQSLSAALKGTRVGIQNLTSASYTLARGIVSKLSLNPDKDVKYVSIGQTTQAAQAVAAGQVDWAVFTTAQLAFLDQAGVKYKYVRIPGLSRNYVGTQIAVATKDLSDPTKRAAVVIYLRNYLRAFKLERYNIPAFTKLYLKSTNDTTPANTMSADLAYNDYDRILPRQAYGRVGYTSATYWKSLMDYELQAGVLTTAPPVSSVFTSSLIQEANQGTCGKYDTVRIAIDGSIPGATNAELWVAQDQGFFGQESIKVQIVKEPSGAAAAAQVAAGKADLALLSRTALSAAPKTIESVYQSTYGTSNDVFAARTAGLSGDVTKGKVIRALQGYSFARQLCLDSPSACASSYKKQSGDKASATALTGQIKARPLGNSRKSIGYNSSNTRSTSALLAPIDHQQCYWTASRPD